MPKTGIISFAKDWHEDPTSNHHVLRELAKTRRVLWLNSLGTRTPKLTSGRDLGKIRRKLTEFTRGPVNVENDLWVFTPLVLPLPHSSIARTVNQQILRATIAGLRLRLGLRRFQLWTFLPNVADYVGTLGEDLSVYYCVDEWSMFTYLDGAATVDAERRLLERVGCVFAINHALTEAKRAVHPHVYCSPHGVDHAVFARALADDTQLPADLASIAASGGPIVGFYGTLQDWVDQDLIVALAKRRPDWSFVLIGQQLCDVSKLQGVPNIHLLGRRQHHELPAYCKGFSVGFIPYAMIERMAYVNPIKLREYLSAGLPVVSTPVPEVMRYPDWCAVGHTVDEIEAAIARAIADDSPARRQARSQAMTSETWTARVAQVAAIVDELAAGAPHAGARTELPLSPTTPFALTGATGSLGGATLRRLLADGHKVRVLVRRMPDAPLANVEYVVGDLADPVATNRLIQGAETVIHAGATMKGDWQEHLAGTVVGTANVIASCQLHGVKQLVHISSLSVIDWAGASAGAAVSEDTPLEPRAEERGSYTRAKLEAEKAVRAAASQGLPAVILRPGQIFGGGIPLVNGAVARRAVGRWLVLGDGKLTLPLVYIDDVVDAIVAAVDRRLTSGEVIQLIDREQMTQDEVLDAAGGDAKVLRVPRPVVFALGKLSELPLGALGRTSPVALYRLKSALARLRFDSDRAEQLLGWVPRVGVREGIRREQSRDG